MSKENQEMIERALGPLDAFYGKGTSDENAMLVDLDALAEQAIAIECEVEHESSQAEKLTEVMFHDDTGSILTGLVRGHQGREGKALAIIISLQEE